MNANPFDLMIANKSHIDVLKAAAMISKYELDNAAAKIPDEHVVEIAMYTSTNCRAVGIQETLISGCLLSLFGATVEIEGRRELYPNMLEDLGLSRTQSFRCRSVWTHFGVPLLEEPMLRKFFASESLKILAEERTPDEARQEALKQARQGERVSIKAAKALQVKHGVGGEVEKVASPQVSSAPKPAAGNLSPTVWLFSGHVVRVRLESTHAGEPADLSEVIRDLEAAIEEFRERGSAILMAETTAA